MINCFQALLSISSCGTTACARCTHSRTTSTTASPGRALSSRQGGTGKWGGSTSTRVQLTTLSPPLSHHLNWQPPSCVPMPGPPLSHQLNWQPPPACPMYPTLPPTQVIPIPIRQGGCSIEAAERGGRRAGVSAWPWCQGMFEKTPGEANAYLAKPEEYAAGPHTSPLFTSA